MKIPYGYLRISINAEEDEINGPDELALSDRFGEFEDELAEHLEHEFESRFPEFTFHISGV